MDELLSLAKNLKKSVIAALTKLDFDAKKSKLQAFEAQVAEPDFWQNQSEAAAVSKQLADLKTQLDPWQTLAKELDDVIEMLELKDDSLLSDLSVQLNIIEDKLSKLKKDLRFSGPYDDHDAIMSLYAGAGGTDAQDWTAMLLRMYIRWCEKNKFKVKTLDQSAGEEAGIKTITIEISGNLAYGKLKNENGVHRLVRLSPFNADSLRQTSFAKVEVLPKIDQPEEVAIDEKEINIDVFRAGGHGGQSVNTTDSAVRITHKPTGLSVSIQNERSQLQNKETAMTILRSKLIKLQMDQHIEKLSELKGPNEQAAWGNQIRSYVLHPYKMVKDLRTEVETADTESVLDGSIDIFIDAF